MFAFIPTLLQWLAPAVLAYFTPARCVAVFKAVVATIEFVAASHSDKSVDEQYQVALEFLTKEYNLLDDVAGLDDSVDQFVKENVFPLLLSFVYGGQHNG